MTEAEALELIAIYTANALESFTLYLSFTIAYLVTAYFVGKNLSRFQIFAVSGPFCIAAISATLSLLGSVQAWIAIKSATSTVIDTVPIYNSTLWTFMMPVILIPGILISLYFMWNVRAAKIARPLVARQDPSESPLPGRHFQPLAKQRLVAHS